MGHGAPVDLLVWSALAPFTVRKQVAWMGGQGVLVMIFKPGPIRLHTNLLALKPAGLCPSISRPSQISLLFRCKKCW